MWDRSLPASDDMDSPKSNFLKLFMPLACRLSEITTIISISWVVTLETIEN